MPYGLSDATIETIRLVMRQHAAVKHTILYGSRAKGNYRDGSDIDLALEGPDITFDELLRIESQLDALDLPYHIDVSIYHQLNHPELVNHIQRVGCVIA
ncbi:MAG: nucleotidyltransferase domain-containing protein [bacterium]